MYILVFLNATGLSLVAFKFIELARDLAAIHSTFGRLEQEALVASKSVSNNASNYVNPTTNLGKDLKAAYAKDPSPTTDPATLEKRKEILSAQIEAYILQKQWGMNTIKTIASVSPILGLLGTVVGVLDAFEKMAGGALGAGAGAFAGGISLALVTTIGGLVVALPHLVAYNYLNGLLDKLENTLENLALEAAPL